MSNRYTFALLFVAFLAFGCNSAKSVAGRYHSRFASNGFFGTRLNLQSDGKFQYRMSGDLMYDTGFGYFVKQRNRIYLDFATQVVEPDSALLLGLGAMSNRDSLQQGDSVIHFGIAYKSGRNKLWPLQYQTRKVIKRAFGYHRRKKYLLLGKHYYYRTWFLIKE